jgi:hypothetical protein
LMVERNILVSNLMSFLAATGVTISPPSQEFRVRRRQLPYDQGRINAQEGREQGQICGQKLRYRPTTIMISPLPSKVNHPPHLADFAALRNLFCGRSRSCCSIERAFFNSQSL